MKKFIFTLFAVAGLIACQSNTQQVDNGEAMEFVEVDSTGMVDIWAYEGVVPAASGNKDSIDYLVIITQEMDSANGVYQMTTTYITADGANRQTMSSRGRKLLHRGTPQNRTANVYRLVPDSGSNQTVNLWVESDTTVVLLDDQMNSPKQPEKYRLKATRGND